MNERIQAIISKLDMQPHPEGGYYKEIYRSEDEISSDFLSERYPGGRNCSTSIYYLLISGSFSAFHKINQDEIWHFYDGAPVAIHIISPFGKYKKQIVGRNLDQEEVPQLVVPGNHWFAAEVTEHDNFSLVGCTVAPGFDFDDFELAKRDELISVFPDHSEIIKMFTREETN